MFGLNGFHQQGNHESRESCLWDTFDY